MTNDKRKQLNAQRVQKMHILMRPNIMEGIKDLESVGWQPIIDVGVYRSPAEQAQKVAQGFSKVYYSFHNVTGKNNKPESEAADIIDVRYIGSWNPPSRYTLQLAAAMENQGLETGIYWGLPTSDRSKIHYAIGSKNYDQRLNFGWDIVHVQAPQSKFTISEARGGYRYNPGAVKPLILTSQNVPLTQYKLNGGDGSYMDTLKVYEGTSYVNSHKWAAWFGYVIGWKEDTRQVTFNEQPVEIKPEDPQLKIIDGTAFLPIRPVAEFTGLGLEVDNDKRTITLSR